MIARKIDLSNYSLGHVTLEDKTHPMYEVRQSLAALCFVTELRLNGVALLEMHRLAQSILDAPGEHVLLSEPDWQRLRRAIEVHEGFTRNEVELVCRVHTAASIEVEEVKQEKQT